MVTRVLRFGVFGLVLVAACSSWDAAVGVRCDEYPAFCRDPAATSDAGAGTSSGAPSSDGGAGADGGSSTVIDAGPPVSFRRDIRPLMNRTETDPNGPGCSMCHYRTTGTQQGINEGQLDMTTLGQLRRGGKTSGNQIVVPGNPEASALIKKLRGTYSVGSRMPWNGPPYWSDAEIQIVANWITQGAPGDSDE